MKLSTLPDQQGPVLGLGLPGKHRAWVQRIYSVFASWQALTPGIVCVALLWAPSGQTQPVAASTKQVAVAASLQQEARPLWRELGSAQQEALSPLKSEWASISAIRKQTWLQLANRMPEMSSEERGRVQQRMNEWLVMSPRQRGQTRIQFQEARQLAPGGRQEHWDAYQALSPDQRRALAAQAAPTAKRPAPPSAPAKPQSGPTSAVAALAKPGAAQAKKNIVTLPSHSAQPKVVSSTIVQARQGATTSLVTSRPKPPVFHQAGMPKLNAGAGFVDPTTLLPLRGPQGIAATPHLKPGDSPAVGDPAPDPEQ
jgi:Protein of unknown function (DUF3106)